MVFIVSCKKILVLLNNCVINTFKFDPLKIYFVNLLFVHTNKSEQSCYFIFTGLIPTPIRMAFNLSSCNYNNCCSEYQINKLVMTLVGKTDTGIY